MKKFLKCLLTGIVSAFLLAGCAKSQKRSTKMENDGGWILTYFLGQGNSSEENALFFAYSRDGLNWHNLNGGKPVFVVEGIGGNRIRDPFVYKKNDGAFVMIATDWTIWQTQDAVSDGYWSNPSPYLILADSNDLITFTNVRRIDFAQMSDDAVKLRQQKHWGLMHAWAPEVFYDESRKEYGVIWSGDGDMKGESCINRTYVNYTKDFVNFSKPEVFFELKNENGENITEIDATIIKEKSKYYMFFKGEANDAKDIQKAVSSTLKPGSFKIEGLYKYVTRGKNQGEQMFTEGPFIIKAPEKNEWYLYADFYGKDGIFGCWKTNDLDCPAEDWIQLNEDEYSLPFGVRHANTVRVTEEELQKLISHYGN